MWFQTENSKSKQLLNTKTSYHFRIYFFNVISWNKTLSIHYTYCFSKMYVILFSRNKKKTFCKQSNFTCSFMETWITCFKFWLQLTNSFSSCSIMKEEIHTVAFKNYSAFKIKIFSYLDFKQSAICWLIKHLHLQFSNLNSRAGKFYKF